MDDEDAMLAAAIAASEEDLEASASGGLSRSAVVSVKSCCKPSRPRGRRRGSGSM